MKVADLMAFLAVRDPKAEVVMEDYFDNKLIGNTVRAIEIGERNSASHLIRFPWNTRVVGEGPKDSTWVPIIILRTR